MPFGYLLFALLDALRVDWLCGAGFSRPRGGWQPAERLRILTERFRNARRIQNWGTWFFSYP